MSAVGDAVIDIMEKLGYDPCDPTEQQWDDVGAVLDYFNHLASRGRLDLSIFDADQMRQIVQNAHQGRGAARMTRQLKLVVRDFWFRPGDRYATLFSDDGGPGLTLWNEGPDGEATDVFDGLIERFCEMTGASLVTAPTVEEPS